MTVEKPIRGRYNGHLTVKLVRLVQHLIKTFTNERQTVLDPFLGSGTTAAACKNSNRKCVAIEINPDYIEIAEKRHERKTLWRDIRPKQFARLGEFHLEEAILDVLLQKYYRSVCEGKGGDKVRFGILLWKRIILLP